jgi:hypothetical protein
MTDVLPARNRRAAITISVVVSEPVTGSVWIPVGGSSPVGGSEPLDPPTDVVGPSGTVVVVPGHGSA